MMSDVSDPAAQPKTKAGFAGPSIQIVATSPVPYVPTGISVPAGTMVTVTANYVRPDGMIVTGNLHDNNTGFNTEQPGMDATAGSVRTYTFTVSTQGHVYLFAAQIKQLMTVEKESTLQITAT
jgi:hypothetical protein